MIYGPNTKAVQAIIDRISALTEDERKQLDASSGAARFAAYDAAYDAAWYAARDSDRFEAWSAAIDAANEAYWSEIIATVSYDAYWSAILATVTYDLATEDGSYTIAQRDLLLAPWVSVCGIPEELVVMDGEAIK